MYLFVFFFFFFFQAEDGIRDLTVTGVQTCALPILLQAVGVAGGDEAAEERMWLKRLGLELGVELAAEKEGVIGQLDDFDVGGIWGGAGNAQACAGEQRLVLAIEFVTVTMAF